MISVRIAIGSIAQVLTRSAYYDLAVATEAHGWSAKFKISDQTRDELTLLKHSLAAFNGQPIRRKESRTAMQSWIGSVFASDASAFMTCAYQVQPQEPSIHYYQHLLTAEEQSQSSGFRELMAIKKALSHTSFPRNQALLWFTDAENLVAFWNKGSRLPHIQIQIVETLRLARQKELVIEMLHLSRSDPIIECADEGSRLMDQDDWGIDEESFQRLQRALLQTEIDAFASPMNARHSVFYSEFKHANNAAIDAFTVSWDNKALFLCPPVKDIPATLRKMKQATGLRAILVLPRWTSSPMWALVFPDGKHAQSGFVKVMPIRPTLRLGQFYAGGMQKCNAYPFMALAYDPTGPFRLRNVCEKGGCSICGTS